MLNISPNNLVVACDNQSIPFFFFFYSFRAEYEEKNTALKNMFRAILMMKRMQTGLSTKSFANLHKCQRQKSGQK